MRKLVVLEVNEIPPKLLDWHAAGHPDSAIARVLATGVLGSTVVDESLDKELYPSQTWASLAMGVPHADHDVYWYGDPKPSRYPLYWQAAARQRSVGIVGTLHSSPHAIQSDLPGMVFALPDAFASDAGAHPASLAAVQEFNLAMTRSNARAVSDTRPIGRYASGLPAAARAGLRPTTAARLAGIAAQVAAGRVPKERLRTAQFLLLADVFRKQLTSHEPDLAVFFTNHVAAAMHRYWPANFPHDWAEPPYDRAWIAKFENEIPTALAALDSFIGWLLDWCEANDRSLLLLSSMGQVGGGEVDPGGSKVLVAEDEERFVRHLGVSAPFALQRAMSPHISMRFEDLASARAEVERLEQVRIDGGALEVDRSDTTVTITYHLELSRDLLDINGTEVVARDIGLRWLEVSEHKAGHHDPIGSLIVANAPNAVVPEHPISHLSVAPAILESLGVDPLPHHREPGFTVDSAAQLAFS